MTYEVIINYKKETELRFEISAEGLAISKTDIRFSLVQDRFIVGFSCDYVEEHQYKVIIPADAPLDKITYKFIIEVITNDGYYFNALDGNAHVREAANVSASFDKRPDVKISATIQQPDSSSPDFETHPAPVPEDIPMVYDVDKIPKHTEDEETHEEPKPQDPPEAENKEATQKTQKGKFELFKSKEDRSDTEDDDQIEDTEVDDKDKEDKNKQVQGLLQDFNKKTLTIKPKKKDTSEGIDPALFDQALEEVETGNKSLKGEIERTRRQTKVRSALIDFMPNKPKF